MCLLHIWAPNEDAARAAARAGKFRERRALSFFLQGSLSHQRLSLASARGADEMSALLPPAHRPKERRRSPREFFTTQRPAGNIFPNVTNANNVKVSRLYDVLPLLRRPTPKPHFQRHIENTNLWHLHSYFNLHTGRYANCGTRAHQRLHNFWFSLLKKPFDVIECANWDDWFIFCMKGDFWFSRQSHTNAFIL